MAIHLDFHSSGVPVPMHPHTSTVISVARHSTMAVPMREILRRLRHVSVFVSVSVLRGGVFFRTATGHIPSIHFPFSRVINLLQLNSNLSGRYPWARSRGGACV